MPIKKLTLYAVLAALTSAVSLLVVIPIPGTNGIVTLCDAGIAITSLLFGPGAGFFVGAISGGFIDLLAGYPQWIVFSLLIHGVQGFVFGYFFKQNKTLKGLGLVMGILVMVIGYALATDLLYGFGAGVASLPSNLFQSAFGVIVAIPITATLKKVTGKRLKFNH